MQSPPLNIHCAYKNKMLFLSLSFAFIRLPLFTCHFIYDIRNSYISHIVYSQLSFWDYDMSKLHEIYKSLVAM